MSHATLTPAPKNRSSLRAATLPKWFPWAVAAGGSSPASASARPPG